MEDARLDRENWSDPCIFPVVGKVFAKIIVEHIKENFESLMDREVGFRPRSFCIPQVNILRRMADVCAAAEQWKKSVSLSESCEGYIGIYFTIINSFQASKSFQ